MPSELSIAEAAQAIRQGGVVAYPTEAVWGLGCDPFAEAAVSRLLAIKQRPVEKGLILIAANLEQLRPVLELNALPTDRLALVLASWPGPHSWVMPASEHAPRWITGTHSGIAVRVSAHPEVVALCQAFGGPLVSTSANLSGQPPVRTRDALSAGLLALLDGVVAGETGALERPTPIKDALSGQPLRE